MHPLTERPIFITGEPVVDLLIMCALFALVGFIAWTRRHD